MTLASCYAPLQTMLNYPRNQGLLVAACREVAGQFEKLRLDCSIAAFARYAATATLAELQEEYVALFDFNPAAALYLGHHRYGDNQKRGEYLIRLKGEYRRHGYHPSGCELPDHLPVILGLLAHWAMKGDDDARRSFIAEWVLPGVEKLMASLASARHESPWQSVLEAAAHVCRRECADETPGQRPAERSTGATMWHTEVNHA